MVGFVEEKEWHSLLYSMNKSVTFGDLQNQRQFILAEINNKCKVNSLKMHVHLYQLKLLFYLLFTLFSRILS